MAESLQRDIGVQVIVAGIEAAADRGRRRTRFGLTDHHVEFTSHPDRLADRILVRKESLGRVVGQHHHLLTAVARCEPSPPCYFQSIQLHVILDASHEFCVSRPVSHAQFEAKLTHGNSAANGRNILDDATVVVSQQAINLDTTVGGLLVTGGTRLLGSYDDVRGAEFLDLLLCPVANAFPHRHQPDHRTGADEDAQRSQTGSHLVRHQVLQA